MPVGRLNYDHSNFFSRRIAFTLVELLVVIGIIAVLVEFSSPR